jgi:hypothetical protein
MVLMRLCPRRLVLALATLWLVPALPLEAGLRASRAEEAPSASRARDVQDARAFLARADVAQALAAHGLSAEEVDHRLDQLSDEDLTTLAANLDQVQAAGAVPNYIWILLGIFLAVSIIVLIV